MGLALIHRVCWDLLREGESEGGRLGGKHMFMFYDKGTAGIMFCSRLGKLAAERGDDGLIRGLGERL